MSRVRSAYEIERDELAVATARHAAVAARVARASAQYRAQELAVAVPSIASIGGMNSSQVRAETARLEVALATCERSASTELDGRCQAAFDKAFAAATERMVAGDAVAILDDQRLGGRPEREHGAEGRSRQKQAQQLRNAMEQAQDSVARILGRLASGVTPGDRARLAAMASMVADATSPAQAERVVLSVRAAVREANDTAERAEARSRQLDQWVERLHHLDIAAARDVQDRVRQLDPTEPWATALATSIEREIERAEADDARHKMLTAARSALTSLGYEVSEGFVHEVPAGPGTLVSIPDRADHRVRVRESRGALLMDVVRVAGALSTTEDTEAEATFCNSLGDLVERTRLGGVNLLVVPEPATGELDYVELEPPAVGGSTDGQEAKRQRQSRSQRTSGARERDRRR